MSLIRLNPDDVLPIIQVRVSDLAPRVLVAGDPARVERMSQQLSNVRQVGANREYVSFTGEYEGESVSVVSHGVGSAGAAAAFEELCRAGAERIIRVGTAGGMQPDVVDGEIVVATAAVRAEGLSARLVPLEYPAVADLDVSLALRSAASKVGLKAHNGIVLTADNFYPSPVLPNDQPMWRDAGVVAVEMEVAGLFTVASLNGVAAGAILAIDGNPLAADDESMAGYEPFREIVDRAVAGTITAGFDALVAPASA
ncbi:MAG TPA: nucleoside phosphorylase [Actinomycetales bacterium]|nr:nucleoside phosphorylase [Actinomycetales bacterium]